MLVIGLMATTSMLNFSVVGRLFIGQLAAELVDILSHV